MRIHGVLLSDNDVHDVGRDFDDVAIFDQLQEGAFERGFEASFDVALRSDVANGGHRGAYSDAMAIAADVLDHAKKEERDEFARLGQELSQHELETMGRAAKLADAIAPTRPHAGVESQLANLVAGPFAAMLDRARDAIVGKG